MINLQQAFYTLPLSIYFYSIKYFMKFITNVSFLYLLLSIPFFSLAQDSLLFSVPKDTQQVTQLIIQAKRQVYQQPKQALAGIKQAIQTSQQLHSLPHLAKAYRTLGFLYRQQDNFSLCKQYYKQALEIYQKIKSPINIAQIYHSLAMIHHRKANYSIALRYLFEALEIFEKQKYISGQGKVYSLMAAIYSAFDSHDQSLAYNLKALHIFEKLQNDMETAYVLGDIAFQYYHIQAYDLALKYAIKSERMGQKAQDIVAELWAVGVKGLTYQKLLQHGKALKFITKAANGYQKIKVNHLTLLFKAYQGVALVATHQYAQAQILLETSLHNAKKQAKKNVWIIALSGLYNLYKAQGKQPLALHFHERYHQVKDSIYTHHKAQEIASRQLSFQMEKEKAVNQQVMLQQKLLIKNNKLTIQKRNTLLYAASIVGLLLLLIIFYVFKSRQKQLNSNKLLVSQNEEIQQQKEEVSLQTEQLKISNEQLSKTNEKLKVLDKFKQELTGMIVHDLKTPLNAIIGLSGDAYTPDFQKNIHQSGTQMLHLVTNILDVQKFEEAQVQLDLQPHSLKKITCKAYQQVQTLLNEKNIQFHQHIPGHVYVQVDETYLIRVFINLLSNASKYTLPGGNISVALETCTEDEQSFCKVLVKDDGIGIPEDFLPHVFDRFSQVNPQAYSTGLGLTFCKLATESHQGKIGVKSQVNVGSTFWLSLPQATPQQYLTTDMSLQSISPELPMFIELSSQEEAILAPFKQQLQQLEIYEISLIKKVLQQLPLKYQAIKNWKEQLEDTLYAWNEIKFKQLIGLPTQEIGKGS